MPPEAEEAGQIGALLRRLVAAHVPQSRVEDALQISTRLLDSMLSSAPSAHTVESLSHSMLFRLVRDGQHASASRLADLIAGLKFERGIAADANWPVLYVLNDLRGTAADVPVMQIAAVSIAAKDRTDTNGEEADGRSPSAEVEAEVSMRQEEARREVHSLPLIGTEPFQSGTEFVTREVEDGTGSSEEEEDEESSEQFAVGGDLPSIRPSMSLQNSTIEKRLVSDMLLIVQGENGKLISLVGDEGEETVKFKLPSDVELPLPMQDMVMYISELGFLFRVIRRRIDENESEQSGLVAQNMCAAILREMDAYYRSLVSLRSSEPANDNDDENVTGLTLRKVYVWSETEKPRLRWLARICDETRQIAGGQILAHLRTHRGSCLPADIHDMMSRIVSCTAAPLNRMLLRWLTEGVLPDPQGEFFVMEDPKVAAAAANAAVLASNAMMEEGGVSGGLAGGPNVASDASNRIWWGLFKLRREMLPGCISSAVAKKALIAGKSIAFLRRCCADAPWIDRVHAVRVAELTAHGEPLFEADGKFNSHVADAVIECARRSASQRLKGLFFDKFDLSHHFGAIKRYLLLSQGDFAQALMDGLAPILDGDGNILRNNLTGFVDAALQGASSYNEETDADILERLDVQIVERSKDVVGWDAFMLTYRVQDAPLNTVFSEQVMEAYLLIFKFLWRLKRMDHLLSVSFIELCDFDGKRRRGIGSKDNVDGVAEVVKRAHFLRMKMTHLVQNMQHYCTVEVLEGSWTVLEADMAAAEDLDGLIQAHSKYLTGIKDRTLLSERSTSVRQALRDVLETIPAFHAAQRGLREEGADEIRARLVEIEERFDMYFDRFLNALQRHASYVDSCVFLVFRLDFNGHYKARRAAAEVAAEAEKEAAAEGDETAEGGVPGVHSGDDDGV